MAEVKKSIGSSVSPARDYSTWVGWEADLSNGAIYSAGDDAIGQGYDDTVFSVSVICDINTTINLNTITATAFPGEEHDGTDTVGVRIQTTANVNFFHTAENPTEFSWLVFDGNAQNNDRVINPDGGGGQVVTVRNCIWHGTSGATSSGHELLDNNSRNYDVLNNIIHDITQTAGGSQPQSALEANTSMRKVMNNTVHNIINNSSTGVCYCIDINDASGAEYRNNIATDAGGTTGGTVEDIDSTSVSNATVDYNGSSDSTATGHDATNSIASLVSSDEFVSTTGGSEDLHLKSGAQCIDAGVDLVTTPTNVEIDIDGTNRDTNGDSWDIGAHLFIAAGGATNPKGPLGMPLMGVFGGPI